MKKELKSGILSANKSGLSADLSADCRPTVGGVNVIAALLIHTVPAGKPEASWRQFTSIKVPILSPVTDNLLFLNQRKDEKHSTKVCGDMRVISRPSAYEDRDTTPGYDMKINEELKWIFIFSFHLYVQKGVRK